MKKYLKKGNMAHENIICGKISHMTKKLMKRYLLSEDIFDKLKSNFNYHENS